MDYVDIIKENLILKSELNKSKIKYNELIKKYKHLNKKYDLIYSKYKNLLIIPNNTFNLDQFKASYLNVKYTLDNMPKVGGIYAYFNEKLNLLYIGQSVNMGNRLKQHFRNGKLKINGHDSEFKSKKDWSFYVLEFIDRNNKSKLDEREAYWIAMGKVATSDKTIINKTDYKKYENNIMSGNLNNNTLEISKNIKQKGKLTNRTRGNNIKM